MPRYKGPARYNKKGFLVLNTDLVYYNKHFLGIDFNNDELKIKDGFITIYKGFEWNGCSFVRDGERDKDGLPSSWKASCVHDALYRYGLIPMKRSTKDRIFYELLLEVNFKFLGIRASEIYYIGVLLFGGIALYLSRKFKRLRGI